MIRAQQVVRMHNAVRGPANGYAAVSTTFRPFDKSLHASIITFYMMTTAC
jgi:hypothetical protein